MPVARAVTGDLDLVPLDRAVQDVACDIGHPLLRTPDAVDPASALLFGDALSVFVAYDRRLEQAAGAADLAVESPGGPAEPGPTVPMWCALGERRWTAAADGGQVGTMRLLVLGGTHFLGRHVVDSAVAAGHEVATFTRGRSGTPPAGVRDLRGDRTDPPALAAALDGWVPDGVVDTSGQSRAAARQAADTLPGVAGYAFVSSLNAYAGWPPGPVRSDDDPTWETDDDDYGPIKADAERILTAGVGGPVLLARAGLICGPWDPVDRLGWWLRRIARGGRVVVPDQLAQPIALVDARDLADWLVRAVEQGWSGGVNATGPAGMTTLGGLLDVCVQVTGSDAELVRVPEPDLLAAGVEPWTHLPLWLPAQEAATAWEVSTDRARELGLASRPVEDTVEDTWAWLRSLDTPPDPPERMPRPGLPAELEEQLLNGHR